MLFSVISQQSSETTNEVEKYDTSTDQASADIRSSCSCGQPKLNLETESHPESPKKLLHDIAMNKNENIQGAVDEICQKYLQDIRGSVLNFKINENELLLKKPDILYNTPPKMSTTEKNVVAKNQEATIPKRKYKKRVFLKKGLLNLASGKSVSVKEIEKILENEEEKRASVRKTCPKRGVLNLPSGKIVSVREVEEILKKQEEEKEVNTTKKTRVCPKRGLINLPSGKIVSVKQVEEILEKQEKEEEEKKTRKRRKTKKKSNIKCKSSLPKNNCPQNAVSGRSILENIEMVSINQKNEIFKMKKKIEKSNETNFPPQERGIRLNLPPGKSVSAEEVKLILKAQLSEMTKKVVSYKKSQSPAPEREVRPNVPSPRMSVAGEQNDAILQPQDENNKNEGVKQGVVPDMKCVPVIRTIRFHLPPGMSVSAEELETILKNKEEQIIKKK